MPLQILLVIVARIVDSWLIVLFTLLAAVISVLALLLLPVLCCHCLLLAA